MSVVIHCPFCKRFLEDINEVNISSEFGNMRWVTDFQGPCPFCRADYDMTLTYRNQLGEYLLEITLPISVNAITQ